MSWRTCRFHRVTVNHDDPVIGPFRRLQLTIPLFRLAARIGIRDRTPCRESVPPIAVNAVLLWGNGAGAQ